MPNTCEALSPEQMLEESLFMALKMRLGNYHDTEDAAQEAVIAMLEAQKRAKEGMPVSHYQRSYAKGAIYKFFDHIKKHRSREFLSLTKCIETGDGEAEFIDRIPEVEGESYQERLARTDEDTFVSGLVDTLPEQDYHVVALRFFRNRTLEEAGAELGISKERVRQVEERALALLRHRYEHAN